MVWVGGGKACTSIIICIHLLAFSASDRCHASRESSTSRVSWVRFMASPRAECSIVVCTAHPSATATLTFSCWHVSVMASPAVKSVAVEDVAVEDMVVEDVAVEVVAVEGVAGGLQQSGQCRLSMHIIMTYDYNIDSMCFGGTLGADVPRRLTC